MDKELQFASDYKRRSKTIYPQDINKSIPERDWEALAKINVCTVGVDAKKKKKKNQSLKYHIYLTLYLNTESNQYPPPLLQGPPTENLIAQFSK